jgi:hypothetical protein
MQSRPRPTARTTKLLACAIFDCNMRIGEDANSVAREKRSEVKKPGQGFAERSCERSRIVRALLLCAWGVTPGDGRVLSRSTPSAARRPWSHGCNKQPAQRTKAHGFASPSLDGYALSRMKGVFDPGVRTLAPAAVTKADGHVGRGKRSSWTQVRQIGPLGALRLDAQSRQRRNRLFLSPTARRNKRELLTGFYRFCYTQAARTSPVSQGAGKTERTCKPGKDVR